MAVTPAQLAKYVQGNAAEDDAYLAQCLAESTALVDKLLGTSEPPASIKDRAVLEAAADLYFRKDTRTGVQQFDQAMGVPEPFPVLRDPRTSARLILQPWLLPAIG